MDAAGDGNFALPGTLTLPAAGMPVHGAVVLVHGSGPNDRDGTVGFNTPLKDLAHGLAARGFAALRYEKRTRVWGLRMQMAGPIGLRGETIDDAVAAALLAARQPELTGKPVFVAGHSQGAMAAPAIARMLRERGAPPAGIVMLAPATSPLHDVALMQLRLLLPQQLPTRQQADAQLAEHERQHARTTAAALRGEKVEGPLLLGAPLAWWRDLLALKPAQEAQTLKLPVLAVFGGRDYQVPPATEMPAMQAAARAEPLVNVRHYAELNHLLMPGRGPGVPPGPQDYAAPSKVPANLLDDLAAWMRSAAR